MNPSTIIKKLFATFPNANATSATVLVYIERLSSIPVAELEAVVNQCIDESEFLPTIAKLKEMHRSMLSSIDTDKAAEGWLSVQRGIAGTYHPEVPKFKDPIVAKVVETMGMYNLRMSENQVADRAHFFKLYEAFANREKHEQKLTPEYKQLRDMHQQENTGDVIEDARRITDRATDVGYRVQPV